MSDDSKKARDKVDLSKARALLSNTETGQILKSFLDSNPRIIVKHDNSLSRLTGDFKTSPLRINISPHSNQVERVLTLVHEARHAMQDNMGITSRRSVSAYDKLITTRFAEADAFSTEAQFAWEMEQLYPDQGYWKVFKRAYSSIARSFETAASKSTVSVSNGFAQRAAFNAYFKTGLMKDYDACVLNRVEEYWKARAPTAMGRGCSLVFDKKRPPDAPAEMSVEFLREFGSVSGKVNYLSGVNTHSPYYIHSTSNYIDSRIVRINKKYPGSDASKLMDILTK